METRSVIGLAVAAIVGGAAALSWSLSVWLAFLSAPSQATAGRSPVITSEFERVGQTGGTVRNEDSGGQWRLAGVTACPDGCPATLANTTVALEELGPPAHRPQPLPITPGAAPADPPPGESAR